LTPRFDDPTVRFSTRAHVDEPPPSSPQTPTSATPRSHHGQSPQGRQGQAPRPQWVAGQVHRQYVSPPGRASPRLASRIDARSNARGRPDRGEQRPGLTDPLPSFPPQWAARRSESSASRMNATDRYARGTHLRLTRPRLRGSNTRVVGEASSEGSRCNPNAFSARRNLETRETSRFFFSRALKTRPLKNANHRR